jgi:hypothetical protein
MEEGQVAVEHCNSWPGVSFVMQHLSLDDLEVEAQVRHSSHSLQTINSSSPSPPARERRAWWAGRQWVDWKGEHYFKDLSFHHSK